jgi:hypothetical protein
MGFPDPWSFEERWQRLYGVDVSFDIEVAGL